MKFSFSYYKNNQIVKCVNKTVLIKYQTKIKICFFNPEIIQ